MQITPEMMTDAVIARVETALPGDTTYRNVAPIGFKRPSNMVELTAVKLDTLGFGSGAVDLQYQYKITTFCEVDEVHDSHLPTLDLRAMAIMAAFAQGYVKVGNRAPKVTACTAKTEFYDYAEVLLTLSLSIDRSEFRPESILPIMEELDMTVQTH